MQIDEKLTQIIGDRVKYARRIKQNSNYLDEINVRLANIETGQAFNFQHIEPPKVLPEVDTDDAASDSSYTHIRGIVQDLLDKKDIQVPEPEPKPGEKKIDEKFILECLKSHEAKKTATVVSQINQNPAFRR